MTYFHEDQSSVSHTPGTAGGRKVQRGFLAGLLTRPEVAGMAREIIGHVPAKEATTLERMAVTR